jgi:hypothetical protein
VRRNASHQSQSCRRRAGQWRCCRPSSATQTGDCPFGGPGCTMAKDCSFHRARFGSQKD